MLTAFGVLALPFGAVAGSEGSLAALVPAEAVAYVEIPEAGAWVEKWKESRLDRAIRATPAWTEYWTSPKGKKFEQFLEAYRGLAGRGVEETVSRIAAKGIAFAVVPEGKEPRFLLLARGEDAGDRFAETTLEGIANAVALATKGAGVRKDYPGEGVVAVFGEKVFSGALDDFLVVASTEALLRETLAREEARAGARDAPNLEGTPTFRAARETATANAAAFGFLDAARIAAGNPGGKLLPKPPKDGGEVFLLGAIRELANAAPFFAISLVLEGREARLSVASAISPEEIALPVRETFFEPRGADSAPRAAAPPGTIAALRLYRDFESFWASREALGAGDDAGFRTAARILFGGMRFEEDILPRLGPRLDFFVCRQTYPELPRAPQVRFPGAVLAWELRDPAPLAPVLAMAFQTGVGLANAQRGQEAKPGLLLTTEKHGETTIYAARYLLPEGDGPLPIEFNVSPACAVAGDRFYLASNVEALRAAIDAGLAPAPGHDRLEIEARALGAILAENEKALVANDMLEKGRDQARAEAEIRALLDLVGLFEGGSISLRGESDRTVLEVALRLRD